MRLEQAGGVARVHVGLDEVLEHVRTVGSADRFDDPGAELCVDGPDWADATAEEPSPRACRDDPRPADPVDFDEPEVARQIMRADACFRVLASEIAVASAIDAAFGVSRSRGRCAGSTVVFFSKFSMPSGVPGRGTYTCMTTANIPNIHAAREHARRPDGRFGQHPHGRAASISLAATSGADTQEPYAAGAAYLEASRAVWALEDIENDHAVAEIARRIQRDHPDAHAFAVGFRDDGGGEVSTVIELMDSTGYSIDRFHAADEWSGGDAGIEDAISDAWDQLYTMLAPGASKCYPLEDCETEFPGADRNIRFADSWDVQAAASHQADPSAERAVKQRAAGGMRKALERLEADLEDGTW